MVVLVFSKLQCNKKCIRDYPNIWPYLRDLYQTPGFGETTNRMHIENGYQVSQQSFILIQRRIDAKIFIISLKCSCISVA